jgi:hypothetical protein
MAYSSSRERGSDAVAIWISWSMVSWNLFRGGRREEGEFGKANGGRAKYLVLHPLVVCRHVRLFIRDEDDF